MFKNHTTAVLIEVALLTVVVVLVDETLLRAGMAFVPALLLAQRALKEPGADGAQEVDERRVDAPARQHVEEFLKQFREFYSTCHLMGSGRISPDEALKRTADLERGLNQLLASVTAMTREKAGRAGSSAG